MVSYLVFALVVLFVAAYASGARAPSRRVGGEVVQAAFAPRPARHVPGARQPSLPALLAVVIWGIVTPMASRTAIVKSRFAAELASMGVPQVEAFIRDARAIAFGGVVGFTDATKEAAAARLQIAARDEQLDHRADRRLRCAAPAFLWAYSQNRAGLPGAPRGRAHRPRVPDRLFGGRHPDDDRHRAVADLRIAALLRAGADLQVPVRHCIGARRAPSPAPEPRPARSTPRSSAPCRCSPARC